MVNHLETLLKSCGEYKIPMHGVRLPTFEIEQKYKDEYKLKAGGTNFDFLKALCNHGFKNLGLKKGAEYDKYVARVKYELETVNDLGFVDYFLLVWYVTNYCKENGIPRGSARGSSAGSLVLYLIEATNIDPLKYGLIFERFISKTRAKKQIVDGITYLDGSLMCDVDLDICYYRRDELLKHLAEKFKGKTSKISTFTTLSGKLLIKECGKIIGGKSESEMTYISGLIPKVFGKVKDLTEAYKEVEEFKKWCDENKDIYNIALKLRNLNKNKGVHASGVMISYGNVEENCPLELSSDKDLVSTFDMNWVSLLNVKLDCLGLRSVSVVDDVCKQLKINAKDIDINNPFIYQQLYDLKYPHGLFQIEAPTNFRVCQQVKPKNILELSAVLALARPGSLQFIDKFAKYSNDGTYESIHPFFDDILRITGGICAYQEQTLAMLHKIGFTLLEAEDARRIIAKKYPEEIKKWEQKIYDKCKENKLDEEIGKILWKICDDSSNYSFNFSHSASYAVLSSTTIFLKFAHPKEFFLSLLKMSKNEANSIEEVSVIQKELQYFNIKLLPPDLRKSGTDFQIEGDDIRFGLSSIKGISDKVIQKLSNLKHEFNSKIDIFQSARQVGLGIGIVSALIQAGALEEARNDRSKCVLEAQLWNLLTDTEKQFGSLVAEEENFGVFNIIKRLRTLTNEKGKPIIKESRFKTIVKNYDKYKQIYLQNIKNKDFCNYYYENALTGCSFSSTLRDIFARKTRDLMSIHEIKEAPEKSSVKVIGMIKEVYSGVSKKKNKYCRMDFSDDSGSIKVLLTDTERNQPIEECKNLNGGKMPKEDDIAIVEGKKGADCIFGSLCAIQTNKIYTRFKDLEKQKVDKEEEKK